KTFASADGTEPYLDYVKGAVNLGDFWQGAQLVETDDRGSAAFPQIAFDGQGNGIAVWLQSDGTAWSIYANRYVAATGTWQGAQLLETSIVSASGNADSLHVALDGQGNAIAVCSQSDGISN